MPEYMYQRGKGKIWYAKRRMRDKEGKRVHIQDCLGTSDQRLARRRLAELELAVERGDYQAFKTKFVEAAEELKASWREEIIIRKHLLPYFKDHTLGGINEYVVYQYVEANQNKPQSSLNKELICLKKIVCQYCPDFKIPRVKYENKGKHFDETQILEEFQVLDVISKVIEKYRIPCLIATYSALRRADVLGLTKKDVNLKNGWITVRQIKTGAPVSIPIHAKLRDAFSQIKVWPLRDNDKFFPGINGCALSMNVKKAFLNSGIPWGSFHHFRHFCASFLINSGIQVEVVQKIMGHADIKSTLVYARIKRNTLVDAMKVFEVG